MTGLFKNSQFAFPEMRNTAIAICAALFLVACASTEKSDLVKTGQDKFVRYVLTRSDAPSVEYYISRPDERSPLVIYLQGSGCNPVFPPSGYGAEDHASTIFSATTMARTYPVALMVINKPYVPKQAPRSGSVAANCPKEFNEYFSLESWLKQIQIAYEHAKRLPWVDSTRTLLVGISEGGTVAAAFAVRNTEITNVAIVGGSGPTQFYDFVASIYASTPDPAKVLEGLSELEGMRAAIAAAPQDPAKFAWGHTYKRWASFFASSSTENLAKSNARIYLVSGMADTSVPILSTEVMYAELLAKGRDVTFRRIPGANHSLMREGVQIKDVEAEYDRILRWYLRTQ